MGAGNHSHRLHTATRRPVVMRKGLQMYRRLFGAIAVVVLFSLSVYASIFGTVKTIVHDPQHRPVAGASGKLKSARPDWPQTGQTNQDGELRFHNVPE